MEKVSVFDTKSKQQTPEKRHPTTRNQQQQLTVTPDRQSRTEARQPTTTNIYQRRYNHTTDNQNTNTPQPIVNRQEHKQLDKVGSNNNLG
jgi:hypothetical protein